MNILIVGSGAREHALAWAIRKNPQVEDIFVAPGNAGTADYILARNLPIGATDPEAICYAAQSRHAELVVVGPENPLALGIVDSLEKLGIPVFGPTQAATLIESSKIFAWDLMRRYNIPCPAGEAFYTFRGATEYLKKQVFPVVIKCDGLAAGKGVTVATNREEAVEALNKYMTRRVFGAAGERVLIQERLFGREVSMLAFTDSYTVVPMVPACDYKRRGAGNTGPNTGGMGSFSSPGILTPAMVEQITETIFKPAAAAMIDEGRRFKGVLYAGLMLTEDGPKVLEFNVRFGDPETQVILPRLGTDLLEIMLAVCAGKLHEVKIKWSDFSCVGVVLAADKYPNGSSEGVPIRGLDKLKSSTLVFQAGTKPGQGGEVVTAGGRILTVVGRGDTLIQAREEAYAEISKICCEGTSCRTDIGNGSLQLPLAV